MLCRSWPTVRDQLHVHAMSDLKKAKELIGDKNFQAALRLCKRILKDDGESYMALVFCGLCFTELQEFEPASKAYRKATRLNPDQTTAWQGLASLLERQLGQTQPGDTEMATTLALQLADTLEELLRRLQEDDKHEAGLKKLVDLSLSRLKDTSRAIAALRSRIQRLEQTSGSEDKIKAARDQLIQICNTHMAELSRTQLLWMKESLEYRINDSASIQNMDYLSLHLRLMFKLRDADSLCSYAVKMHHIFPSSTYALEWICSMYLDWASGCVELESPGPLEQNMPASADALLAIHASSVLGSLAKAAFTFYGLKQPQAASEVLSSWLQDDALSHRGQDNFPAVLTLCRCFHQLGQHHKTGGWIEKALLLLPAKVTEPDRQEALRRELLTMSVKSMYYQEKFEMAIKALEDSRLEDPVLRAKLLARLNRLDQVQALVEQHHLGPVSFVVRAWALLGAGQPADAKDAAQKGLEALPADDEEHRSELLLLVAEADWAEGHWDRVLPNLLAAAKLNPRAWKPFYLLGKLYSHPELAKRDLDRALKCLEKSSQLNPLCQEVGTCLSDLYRQMGKWSENEALLTNLTKQQAGLVWAEFRLGMHYLCLDKPGNAITLFQSVLRQDASNSSAWECLADAYMARGSYLVALKAFTHVLDMVGWRGEASHYPRLQMAAIHILLGQLDEAISTLEPVLAEHEDYVPGLKCKAEALLGKARECTSQFLDQSARDLCQEAVRCLTAAIVASGSGQLSCLWKLLGDALFSVVELSGSVAVMTVPKELINRQRDEERDRAGLMTLCVQCYLKALSLDQDNAGLWHDLAVALHSSFRLTGARDSDLRQAEWCARKACSLASDKPQHWNLLGVISFSEQKYALAQHCFIKSLQLGSTAVAWTHLGAMYLILGKYVLANRAFSMAQGSDPSYLKCWLGQALLAEMLDCGDNALDLFHHTVSIGNDLESSVGFGYWICNAFIQQPEAGGRHALRTRYLIDKMFGVTLATDCLTRYVQRVHSDVCSLNLLGLLLEREGRLQPSLDVFRRAERLCQGRPGPEGVDEQALNGLLQNMGRVLCKLQIFTQAVDVYSRMPKANLYSSLGLALCLHKSRTDLSKAYEAYKQALDMATGDDVRSHVLVAMAMIAYELQGANAAKTLLFQAAKLNPQSVNGLFALCILGIRQQDASLIRASLSQLSKYEETQLQYLAHIVRLKALVQVVLQKKPHQAKLAICRAIHKWPQLHELRSILVMFALQFGLHSHDSNAICRSAEIAASLSAGHKDAVQTSCLLTLSYLHSHVSGNELARNSALTAVHSHPDSPETWAVLVASLFYGYGPSHASWYVKTALAKAEAAQKPDLVKWLQNFTSLDMSTQR